MAFRFRIADGHRDVLPAMAREVNTVWSYCGEASTRPIRERRRFLSGFNLQKLTKGYGGLWCSVWMTSSRRYAMDA